MLSFGIKYWIDIWVFAAVALGMTLTVHYRLRKTGNGGMPRWGWIATLAVIGVAAVLADSTGNREGRALRDRLEGLAPTYAGEVQLMDHAKITFDAPPDDPRYLKIINAEIRWEKANLNVNDIYTYRRNKDGKPAFVVDSETDYDHDGKIDAEREERTAIGEVYDQATPNFMAALDGQSAFDSEPYSDRWGTWISAYEPLYGPDGKVEAALGVDFDAGVWDRDVEWARAGAIGIAGLMMAIVVSASAIITISRSELKKRERLQRQLVDASRQAGMAEVATGVLHNVGNVLNSVNTSAGVLVAKVRGSKIAGFGKAADIIRQNRGEFAKFITNDAKGRMLPDYLIQLSELLNGEQQDMLGELTHLNRSLDHVKQIVASQQTFAKSVDVIETFELGDLIQEALRMNAELIDKHRVEVDCGRVDCPPLTADRHLLLQVLVNLVSNAVRAMDESPVKRLAIDIETVKNAADEPAVRIQMTDTGVGIDKEQLEKLFTHGYTTRADGHGFGLHHSAIIAHNMRGYLTAASDGRGKGATFTLDIPLHVPAKGESCQPN